MRKHLLTLVLLTAVPLAAQNQPQQEPISVQAQAMALSSQATTAAASDVGFAVHISSSFALRAETIQSPTANSGDSVNVFVGGIEWSGKPFDGLTRLLRLDTDHFQFYATGSLGVDRVTDHTGDVHQHIAALAGGGLRYDPTGSGRYTVRLAEVRYGWLPGLIGTTTNNVIVVSTGLQIRF